MLLHNYLQLKSAIYTKAKAEVDTLLAGITDPKMKEAVDDWDFGDPITDAYPQVDQKKGVEMEKAAETAPVAKAEPPIETIPPVVEPVKPEENTNHPA